MKRNVIETVMGAVVLLGAAAFLVLVYRSSASLGGGDGYELRAKFGRVDGIVVGSDVRLAGIKIGSVTGQELDRKTFQAELRFSIADDIDLPIDTSAKIVSDGLLGSQYVSLDPGGDDAVLQNGAEIKYTQDPISFADIVAHLIFGDNGSDKEKDAQ